MSEELLIGGCLWDPAQHAVARHTVTGGMFQREAHRILWEAMCTVADRGAVPDPPTVLDHLGATVDRVGGAVAVHSLYRDATPHNVGYHAVKVVEAHRRRKLSAACGQARADLEDGSDPDQVLADVNAAAGRPAGQGMFRPSDLAGRLDDLLAGVTGQTWSTGWPSVDEIWRPAPGTLTVVTGVPGAGKSQVLDPVVLHQVRAGRTVAVWSPEQAPPEQHLGRLVWSWNGRDPKSAAPADVRQTLAGWDGRLFLFDPDEATVDSVLARAAGLQATSGLDVLLIDPWNKLAHPHIDRRQDLYLQAQLARITRFSRSTGCAVWVVAHPTKLQRKPGTETCWTPPTIYDISGGAEWANQADVVLTVWRNATGEGGADPRETMLITSKVRREEWGRIGRRSLRFAPDLRTFGAVRQPEMPL